MAPAVLPDDLHSHGPIPDDIRFNDLGPAANSTVHAFRSRERPNRAATAALLGRYNLPPTKQALDTWVAGR